MYLRTYVEFNMTLVSAVVFRDASGNLCMLTQPSSRHGAVACF
jgi:hypothetical protein